MAVWIDKVIVKMHRHKITQKEIADKYGCNREFMNRILNGAVAVPKGAKEKIETAIDEIIASKE